MEKYKAETPRISVKYVNAETEEILFEINNRSFMDVMDLLSEHSVNSLFEKREKPEKLMIIVVRDFNLKTK